MQYRYLWLGPELGVYASFCPSSAQTYAVCDYNQKDGSMKQILSQDAFRSITKQIEQQ